MTQPFLSVITISFNQLDYLRQTVDSVLSQKESDVQYIVVDAGSTDGSREMLQNYGSAIDHLILEPDRGPADGLNKGFGRALGIYGYFLNSDDYLLPHAISKMRAHWREQAQADVMLAGSWLVGHDGKAIRKLRATPVSVQALVTGRVRVIQQGMSFKMKMFNGVGGFNILNRTCWDRELLCAMLNRKAKITLSNACLATFRLHDQSITSGASGAGHAKRYDADNQRLLDLYGSEAFDKLSYAISRVASYVSDPHWALSVISEKLIPELTQKRFERDCRAEPS
jgi:hypothetical protein